MKQDAIEKILHMLYPDKPYEKFLMRNEDDIVPEIIVTTVTDFVDNMLDENEIWGISKKNIKIFKICIMSYNNAMDLFELAYNVQIPKNKLVKIFDDIKKCIIGKINERKIESLTKDMILKQNIDELQLSETARNILIRNKKTILEDIIKMKITDLDFLSTNKNAKQEIINKIHSLGLIFEDEDTRTPLEKLQDEYKSLKEQIEQYNQELAHINKKRGNALEKLNILIEKIKEETTSKTL